MQCPDCGSQHIRKNGHRRGKQNYICVHCERQFIESYTSSGGYQLKPGKYLRIRVWAFVL